MHLIYLGSIATYLIVGYLIGWWHYSLYIKIRPERRGGTSFKYEINRQREIEAEKPIPWFIYLIWPASLIYDGDRSLRHSLISSFRSERTYCLAMSIMWVVKLLLQPFWIILVFGYYILPFTNKSHKR